MLEIDPETKPLPVDPDSLGIAEKTMETLTDRELTAAQNVIYRLFGLTQEVDRNSHFVRSYQTQTVEDAASAGEVDVVVYATNLAGQNIFLHEMTFPDQKKRWALGGNLDI